MVSNQPCCPWIESRMTFLLVVTLSIVLADGSGLQAQAGETPTSRVAAVYLHPGDDQYSSHVVVSPPPLRLSEREWSMLRDRRINPPCGGHDFLPYKVRISAEGLVEDATLQPYVSWCNNRKSPPDPPPFIRNHLAEARALFQQARFRPWVVNGHITSVLISSGIEIAPPENYGRPRPFPSPVVQSTVLITMQRKACEGKCPIYNVTLHGNGAVEYEGFAFVAVLGKRTIQIGPSAIAALLRQFEEAKFFSALPDYRGAYDGGETLLQISVNGTSHTVNDAIGLRDGMPTAIRDLESSIDLITNAYRWVYGPL
jgi:Domain of unknown function (DUF6438)